MMHELDFRMEETTMMLRNGCIILCLALVVIIVGCANPPKPALVPDTRQADLQAVRDLEAALMKAKDIDTMISYFADDASGLYPGMPMLDGKQAIKAPLAPMFADANYSFTFQSSRIEASKGGDMIYSQGTYALATTDAKTKKPKTEKGKYLTIYRKQTDGNWKVVADAVIPESAM
jgi:uncharacterized protein (TIGR02246 family)